MGCLLLATGPVQRLGTELKWGQLELRCTGVLITIVDRHRSCNSALVVRAVVGSVGEDQYFNLAGDGHSSAQIPWHRGPTSHPRDAIERCSQRIQVMRFPCRLLF